MLLNWWNQLIWFELYLRKFPLEKLPLSQVFSACGEIVEIRMIKDPKGNLKVNLCATHFLHWRMIISNASFFPITIWQKMYHRQEHGYHFLTIVSFLYDFWQGFCFVRFATKESAARAVREKSGTVVRTNFNLLGAFSCHGDSCSWKLTSFWIFLRNLTLTQ